MKWEEITAGTKVRCNIDQGSLRTGDEFTILGRQGAEHLFIEENHWVGRDFFERYFTIIGLESDNVSDYNEEEDKEKITGLLLE